MIKTLRILALTIVAGMFALASYAQKVTIKGNIKNASNSENVGAVSVFVKGTDNGTYSDANGNFSLNVASLPVTLVFSSIGFQATEVVADKPQVQVSLKTATELGTDVVISASRVPQRILESPVSIERINNAAIKSAPAASFYDMLQNLKGVDMMASSLTFKTPTTRGFNASGNTRFTQLIDGMDNQAPGLNFSVGGVIGLTELDVDNMELLPGASSALYGPGGMNGTLLITSKNPFKYQGLSFQVKTGMMHTDKWQRSSVGSYNNWAVRYAQKLSDKFAYKITTELIQAKDWVANDYRNYNRIGTNGALKPGNRLTDPGYDGVNVYGDETSISWAALLSNFAAVYGASAMAAEAATMPAGQLISRTGYKESDIIDPNTINYKLGGSLNYKLTDKTEASFTASWGTGNTVYTGSERYSLQDLKMGQYKFELNNKKWMLRAFTTQENSGNSYNATVAARLTNEALMPSSTWFPLYAATYLQRRFVNGFSVSDAHIAARSVADASLPAPGSAAFRNAFNTIKSKPIGADPVKAGGARFLDRSDLYAVEGQYNLSEYTKNFADILIGGNFRKFVLNSKGTLFADSAGAIGINEYGGYIQASKEITPKFKLVVSGRYDKNQNFKGRFTPRATATYKVSDNGTIRASFQTAYRFPSTQQQWINLDVGSSVRLLGAHPNFSTFYKYNTNKIYTLNSVLAGTPQVAVLPEFKPESVTSYELGYKGLHANKKLLVDLYGYYGQYQNFIVRTLVAQAKDGNVANIGNAANRQIYSIPTNNPGKVTTYGWGIGFDYRLPKNFTASANVSSDVLKDVATGLVAFFNSPKYRTNLSLSNSGFGYKKRMSAGISYRWQDAYFYEGDLANGMLPAVNIVDAQFSYRIPAANSTFKVGANNLLNQYYRTGFANPMIGGLYYVGYAYNF